MMIEVRKVGPWRNKNAAHLRFSKKPFQASCVPLGPTSLYHIESTFMKVPFQMCPTAEKIHFNMNFVFGKWYDRPAWWLLRSQWSRWSKRMLPKRFQTQPLFEILQNSPQTVKELFPISTQNCMKKLHVEPDWTWQNNKSQFWRKKLLNKRENIIKEWCPLNFATLCTLKPFCRRMNQIVAPVWPLPGVNGILHKHFFSASTSSILTSSWIFWNIEYFALIWQN